MKHREKPYRDQLPREDCLLSGENAFWFVEIDAQRSTTITSPRRLFEGGEESVQSRYERPKLTEHRHHDLINLLYPHSFSFDKQNHRLMVNIILQVWWALDFFNQ